MTRLVVMTLLALSACVESAEPQAPPTSDVPALEEVTIEEMTIDEQPEVCACDSTECVEAYIAETLGCDVCVAFSCDDQPRHGCVLCEPNEPGREPNRQVTAPVLTEHRQG